MANEVDIVITATDLTGPGFRSAISHVVMLASAIRALKSQLNDLAMPNLDASKMQTGLLLLKSKLQSLHIADIADVNVQPGLIMTQLNLLKRLIQQAGISDLLDVNVSQGNLNKAISNIKGMSETIPVSFSVSNMPKLPIIQGETIPIKFASEGSAGAGVSVTTLASWAKLTDETQRYGAGLPNLMNLIGGIGNAWGTAGARAQIFADAINHNVNTGLVATGIIFDRIKYSIANATVSLMGLGSAAVAAMGGGGGGGGGGIAGLNAGWGGFGAKLSYTIPLIGLTIRSVALWHVALDAIIETLISVGLAAAAAAVGIASMMPTMTAIKDHMTSVNAVGSSLNSSVLPKLDQQFDALGKSMAPRTVEAFGGALNLVSNNVGGLGNVAQKVVTLFDDWIAKMDIFASGKGFGQFLTAGIGYLTQFGSIIGNLGAALSNLLTKDPGIAHFLLDVIGGLVGLLKAFSNLPGPVVEAVLALHGLYVWASVIAPALLTVVGTIGKMGLSLLGLAANPFTWVAAAGLAMAYLAMQSGRADGATRSLIAGIDQQISGATASQAILDIASAVGQLSAAANAASSSQAISNIKSTWNSLGNTATSFDADMQVANHSWMAFWDSINTSVNVHNLLNIFDTLGSALKNTFVPGAGASIVAANNMKALDTEINKLITDQGTLFRVAGRLTEQHLSLAQSFALMDLAGVQSSDTLQLALQKVHNLITGYAALGVQAGILSNSVNAITFQTELQDSKIATVTGAWTNFFSIIANGLTGMYSFGTAMATLTGQTLPGLSAANTTLGNNFLAAAQAAQTEANNMMTLSAAGGDGSKGTDLITSSIKDMIVAMLPAAKGSANLTTVLYALAQQGGYQGANSFKALSGWVTTASGSIAATKDPSTQLQNNLTALETAAGNLTTDVKNLSLALGQDLTQAEAAAIQLAAGGTAPFDNFAKAIAQTGADSKTTRDAAITLGDEFLTMANNNVPAAQREFESFAIGGLGLTKSQADALWADVINHGLPALGSAGSAAIQLQKHMQNLGLNISGVTTQVGGLSSAILTLPNGKTINVQLYTSGSGEIIVTGTGISTRTINTSTGQVSAVGGHTAKGGHILGGSGHPTADDIMLWASNNEFMMQDKAVRKYGVPFMEAINAGKYSMGGLVTAPIGRAATAVGTEEALFGQASAMALAQAADVQARAKLAAMQAAASNAVSSSGARTESIAVEQAYAASLMPGHGWVAKYEMPPLISLWNQESGWNPYAANPTSNARGIPQNINGWSAYAPGDYKAQIQWGENYIAGRYGAPGAAWAHEQAYNWYDNGGWLRPGMNHMYNGTGRPEHLTPDSGGGMISLQVSGGSSDFEQFLVGLIRKHVKVRYGGNAQKAFGSAGTVSGSSNWRTS